MESGWRGAVEFFCIRHAEPTRKTSSLRRRRLASRRCTKTSTATSTSLSSSRTIRRPTCTSGTAATSTSPPTKSSRSKPLPQKGVRHGNRRMGVCRPAGVVRAGRSHDRADIHTGCPAVPQDPAHVASADHPISVRILVAGIGNIFLGDDGFGSEVVRHVPVQQDNSGVRVVDYGIGGMHLAYDLLEGWDALVIVDAIPSRGSPGALHIFEADHESPSATAALDTHSMDPAAVFASLKALGGRPPYTVVVGCEAGSVDEGIGLTKQVAKAVPRAVRAVEEIIAALQSRACSSAGSSSGFAALQEER